MPFYLVWARYISVDSEDTVNMNAFLERLYMICYVCLIHTNDLPCTITKIQSLTHFFLNMVNFLMRYPESFGRRGKQVASYYDTQHI